HHAADPKRTEPTGPAVRTRRHHGRYRQGWQSIPGGCRADRGIEGACVRSRHATDIARRGKRATFASRSFEGARRPGLSDGRGSIFDPARTLPDPVGAGFVQSLAHPGGNATGFTSIEYGMSGKWLELMRDIAPGVTRVAVLRDPTLPAGIA